MASFTWIWTLYHTDATRCLQNAAGILQTMFTCTEQKPSPGWDGDTLEDQQLVLLLYILIYLPLIFLAYVHDHSEPRSLSLTTIFLSAPGRWWKRLGGRLLCFLITWVFTELSCSHFFNKNQSFSPFKHKWVEKAEKYNLWLGKRTLDSLSLEGFWKCDNTFMKRKQRHGLSWQKKGWSQETMYRCLK